MTGYYTHAKIANMMYLIGVDHFVQYKGSIPEKIRNQFKQFITCLIQDSQITVIAEEFNPEALEIIYHSPEGAARSVADKINIFHHYCDPLEKNI
ncbi:MAG: hypothetical protein MJB14_06620 [Spirochaetes bacterium]|nr:hypothetical protein [Spirochaetota bacterium]